MPQRQHHLQDRAAQTAVEPASRERVDQAGPRPTRTRTPPGRTPSRSRPLTDPSTPRAAIASASSPGAPRNAPGSSGATSSSAASGIPVQARRPHGRHGGTLPRPQPQLRPQGAGRHAARPVRVDQAEHHRRRPHSRRSSSCHAHVCPPLESSTQRHTAGSGKVDGRARRPRPPRPRPVGADAARASGRAARVVRHRFARREHRAAEAVEPSAASRARRARRG